MDRGEGGGAASCEENDRAAGILVRDDYVISRNGHGNKREDMPIRDMLCIYACRATPSISTCVYTEPRASIRRIAREAFPGICAVSTGPRIGIRYVRTYVRTYARNECVPACGFAIILSITPGVNLRRRLAERRECTLMEIMTI